MKKTIVTVFLIIAVLVIALMAFNVATNGKVWSTIGNAVAEPINTGWKKITGGSNNLIEVDAVLENAGIQDKNSVGGLTA